jgi:hypothetical protein
VRSIWLPVTVEPDSVVPVSTFCGSRGVRPQGRQAGASPRPFLDWSMRRWRAAEIGSGRYVVVVAVLVAVVAVLAVGADSIRANGVSVTLGEHNSGPEADAMDAPAWERHCAAAASAFLRAASRASDAQPCAEAPCFPNLESACRRAIAASLPLKRGVVQSALAWPMDRFLLHLIVNIVGSGAIYCRTVGTKYRQVGT